MNGFREWVARWDTAIELLFSLVLIFVAVEALIFRRNEPERRQKELSRTEAREVRERLLDLEPRLHPSRVDRDQQLKDCLEEWVAIFDRKKLAFAPAREISRRLHVFTEWLRRARDVTSFGADHWSSVDVHRELVELAQDLQMYFERGDVRERTTKSVDEVRGIPYDDPDDGTARLAHIREMKALYGEDYGNV